MTTSLAPVDAQPRGGMPAWGIVADLTPPELIMLRRVAVLRRRILVGLLAVVALVVSGYALAHIERDRAAERAATAAAETSGLTRSVTSYASITRAESTIARVEGQIGTVMGADVDVPRTLAAIRAALPASMSMSSVSMTLNQEGTDSGASGLDATGRTSIGTLTISGSGRSLDDLPAFVDRLTRVKGLVDVLPTSNQVSKGAAQFNVSASLTDALRSHRYDAAGTAP